MISLAHISFAGPTTVHSRVLRDIARATPFAQPNGTVSLGWDLHLHPEWGCVVITSHDGDAPERALVPLVHVRSMVLHEVPQLTVVPGDSTGRRGRPRTKRLDMATTD